MGKRYDLTGQKFGKLTVLNKTINPNNKKNSTFLLCRCDCGKESIVTTSALVSGKTTQCWDCAHLATGAAKRKDLTENRYGKLVVQKMIYGEVDAKGKQRTYCECLCDCGNVVRRVADSLEYRKGVLASCGCARKEIADAQSKDIIGQKFGRLTVIEEFKDRSPREVRCICDCGNEIILKKTEVMSLHTKSCGCLHREMTSLSNTKDWTGYVSDYGVKAIKQACKNDKGQWLWEFECPLCENHFIALPAHVTYGRVTSCGCKITSSGEKLIKKYLEDNDVSYIPQYSISECRYSHPLRFDFALLNNGQPYAMLEYNGKQHYEPVEFFGGEEEFLVRQKRDEIKRKYCRKNNIIFKELKYDLSPEQIKEEIANIIYA